MIIEVAGGEIVKGVIDIYPEKGTQTVIDFSIEKCNNLLGIELKESRILEIFSLLDIKV